MRTELTDALVHTAAPEAGKSELLCWDTTQDGLCLRVRPNGTRSYVVRYMLHGEERRLTLGEAGKISLSKARYLADDARSKAKDGIDPADTIRPQAPQAPQASYTLKKAADDYLTYLAAEKKSNSTQRQAKLYLTGTYFAPLHGIDIGKVTKKDVADRLTAIVQDHSRITAGAARSSLSALYFWLNKKHFDTVEYNPVKGTDKYKNDNVRDRVLSDSELAAIWKACGDDRYGKIVRLLILTGCRRQEVGGLCKAEVDLYNRTWTIPASRYKTNRPHTVYLAPAAVDLVASLLSDTGDAEFQHWSHCKAALDARLGDKVAPWTHHDLRRTMSTQMSEELEVPDSIIERALGHKQEKIKLTYNKNKYAKPLRAAWEQWAARVAQLTGDNVVVLPVKQSVA